MKKTSKIILGLSVAVCAVAGVAFANFTPTTAKADDLETTLSTGFIMETGARVRYASESEGSVQDYSGIRYEMLLNTASYNGIVSEAKASEDKKATFGMLIAPASYHEKAKLNVEENVFGETAVYNWGVWNAETGIYDYVVEEGKTQIVNVSTTIDYSGETHEDLAKIVRKSDGDTYYHYCGSLTKIQEKNLSREFIGVGYVYVNGEYYFAKEDDNVRSIAYVAQRAIEDTSTQEELDVNARKWLQQNYVDTVTEEATKYTIEYTIPGNYKNGGVDVLHVVNTEEREVTIDDDINLTEEDLATLPGFVAPTVSAKAYANDKTKIQVNYAYADGVKGVVALQGQSKTYAYDTAKIYRLVAGDTFKATNGIFMNTTEEEITLTVGGTTALGGGGNGSAAIVDKNGRVIEGRDGLNGKLMNEANPVRSTSTATLDVSKFATNMVIPAGGFAVVIQNPANYTGGVAYGDGDTTTNIRNFMNSNIISNYGNVVRITLNDAENNVLDTLVEYAFTIKFMDETGKIDKIIAVEDETQFSVNENFSNNITKTAVRLYTEPVSSYGFSRTDFNWSVGLIIDKETKKVVKCIPANTTSTPKSIYDTYTTYVNENKISCYLLFFYNDSNTKVDDAYDSGASTVRQSVNTYGSKAVGKTISISCCEL